MKKPGVPVEDYTRRSTQTAVEEPFRTAAVFPPSVLVDLGETPDPGFTECDQWEPTGPLQTPPPISAHKRTARVLVLGPAGPRTNTGTPVLVVRM